MIPIAKNTPLHHIKRWKADSDESLCFRVQVDSGFQVFAEGVALAKLADLLMDVKELRVELTFPVRTTDATKERTQFFETLFGISLLHYSKTIKDANGANIRDQLARSIWDEVIRGGGAIGGGKYRCIVFRDPDYAIPTCLREQDRRSFPSQARFRRVINDLARRMSNRPFFGGSSKERMLASMLYEASHNCHEHGRASHRDNHLPRIRGISITKHIASSSNLSHLFDYFSKEFHPFVKHQGCSAPRNLILISISVSDIGPGIQNTLPSVGNESARQRFMRAFKAGESRKPKGIGIEMGQGLPKILYACQGIRALLFLHSADLSAVYDPYSHESKPYQEALALGPFDGLSACGTGVSIVWAAEEESYDQKSLFPDLQQ